MGIILKNNDNILKNDGKILLSGDAPRCLPCPEASPDVLTVRFANIERWSGCYARQHRYRPWPNRWAFVSVIHSWDIGDMDNPNGTYELTRTADPCKWIYEGNFSGSVTQTYPNLCSDVIENRRDCIESAVICGGGGGLTFNFVYDKIIITCIIGNIVCSGSVGTGIWLRAYIQGTAWLGEQPFRTISCPVFVGTFCLGSTGEMCNVMICKPCAFPQLLWGEDVSGSWDELCGIYPSFSSYFSSVIAFYGGNAQITPEICGMDVSGVADCPEPIQLECDEYGFPPTTTTTPEPGEGCEHCDEGTTGTPKYVRVYFSGIQYCCYWASGYYKIIEDIANGLFIAEQDEGDPCKWVYTGPISYQYNKFSSDSCVTPSGSGPWTINTTVTITVTRTENKITVLMVIGTAEAFENTNITPEPVEGGLAECIRGTGENLRTQFCSTDASFAGGTVEVRGGGIE